MPVGSLDSSGYLDVPTINAASLVNTVPLPALSGITSAQLDPSAGLVSTQIISVDAATITGLLDQAHGGTGLDSSAATDGQVLIGKTSDHSLNLATITGGSGISITNGPGAVTIDATGSGTGTVTSVGLTLPAEFVVSGSPVSTTGSLSAAWDTESANRIFAGPTSGIAATPGFRTLVAADVPNLPATILTSGTLNDARLSANVPLENDSNQFTALNLFDITTTSNASLQNWFQVRGVYTLSGTASYTTLTVLAAEVSLGSGDTLLADFRVGPSLLSNSSVASIDHNGYLWATSIEASVLTGTVPLASLSGITTSQLSGSAGITSGQIASVAASTISGTLAQAHGGTGIDSSAVTNGQLLIGKTSDNSLNLAALTAGSGISITNGAGAITVASTSSATVSSVGLSLPAEFSVSGSPVSTSGTLSAAWANESANQIFSGPTSGGAATPAFRALVAADIGVVNPSALTGSGTVPLAALSGITTTQLSGSADILGSQLSASAAIAAGQIASVNPSTLTGSGTVPLAGLSGLTTTQLSGTAGIVAGQIASVNPSVLTGSGTVPLAGLAGITTSQLSATAGITSGQIASIPNQAASIITSGQLALARGGTAVDNSTGIAQHAVWAGPSGSSGTAAYRALVASDIPALSYVTSVGLTLPAELTVAGSPVTASGSLSATWSSETQNFVFAAPSASSGTPAFRALVAGDIPALAASKITSGLLAQARGGTNLDTSAITNGQLLIGQSSDHSFGLATLTAGSGITVTNAGHSITVAATGSGTVTSVGLSLPAELTVSHSPVTTADTLTAVWANESANRIFGGPTSGSAATPTFRALASADLPNFLICDVQGDVLVDYFGDPILAGE